jgi:hypothetical protein
LAPFRRKTNLTHRLPRPFERLLLQCRLQRATGAEIGVEVDEATAAAWASQIMAPIRQRTVAILKA